MAKRHERTLARRSALQALYQSEILGVPADKVLEEAREVLEGMEISTEDRLLGAFRGSRL